ncbi:phosphatidate cytidylyltransferase [Natronosporangium hydrolyticum]|uniref:Phosphatidate cytidylyltransferase n=1 Tax=Natronosporangium hydrolyticum TaxID=2811111 RepID=A0A895Y6Y5_9ACTN|nr:phosphatidate cytidylyltransferase [Natronosporangium hydrolyticum]QSB13504.1 phosphatidate cytidylyltransferase [Natronosporangium hydrolyticum]
MGDLSGASAGGAPLPPQSGSDPLPKAPPSAPHAADAPPSGGGSDQPSPAQPRAGRNLPAAFAVGGALAVAVLASLLVWRPAFLVVVVAAVAVGTWETTRAVQTTGARPPLVPLLVGGAVMSAVGWFIGPAGLTLGLLLTAAGIFAWRLAAGPDNYLRDVGSAFMIAVYVPFLAGFAALLGAADDGHWRVLVTLAVVVLCDTGGYVAGVFFGRHPLAPRVSPKKSWEGLVGSLLAAATGGAVGLWLAFGVGWWWGALFGLLVAGAAVLGDLTESVLKRDLKVKDMSGLLPGHGGLMDRLDSILFAAPAAYLLLSVVAH